MINAISDAGYPGVEAEGEVIHARLPSSQAEWFATPEGDLWRFAIKRQVRATEAQMAEWNSRMGDTPMDIHLGETRVSMMVAAGDAEAIRMWDAVAEECVATTLRWRRAQRERGEGM